MFTIYSKPNCPQCDRAKILLTSRSVPYNEVIIDVGQEKDPTKKYITASELKILVPTAKSVPQIFKGTLYVGGFPELQRTLG